MIIVGRRGLALGACALAIGLAVQGCREDEQGRALHLEKGTYLGQPDQPLSDEQVEALQQRASNQNM